jgi:DNA repair exonuclease SbcCD ATPase subunit
MMLIASAILAGVLQPPNLDSIRLQAEVRQALQRAADVDRRWQDLQKRSADTDRELNESLQNIERMLKDIDQMTERFEKNQKSKMK